MPFQFLSVFEKNILQINCFNFGVAKQYQYVVFWFHVTFEKRRVYASCGFMFIF